jgi:hypothetical protein
MMIVFVMEGVCEVVNMKISLTAKTCRLILVFLSEYGFHYDSVHFDFGKPPTSWWELNALLDKYFKSNNEMIVSDLISPDSHVLPCCDRLSGIRLTSIYDIYAKSTLWFENKLIDFHLNKAVYNIKKKYMLVYDGLNILYYILFCFKEIRSDNRYPLIPNEIIFMILKYCGFIIETGRN